MTKNKPDWDHDDEPKHDTKPVAQSQPEGAPKLVRIRCTSHASPFTEKKALAFDEEADVSPEVAKALVDRGLCEMV